MFYLISCSVKIGNSNIQQIILNSINTSRDQHLCCIQGLTKSDGVQRLEKVDNIPQLPKQNGY